MRFSPSNNFSFQAMRSIKEEEEAFQLAPACRKCRRDEDILSPLSHSVLPSAKGSLPFAKKAKACWPCWAPPLENRMLFKAFGGKTRPHRGEFSWLSPGQKDRCLLAAYFKSINKKTQHQPNFKKITYLPDRSAPPLVKGEKRSALPPWPVDTIIRDFDKTQHK